MSDPPRKANSLPNSQYNAHILRTDALSRRFQVLFGDNCDFKTKCNSGVFRVSLPNLTGIQYLSTPRIEVTLGPTVINALVDSGSARTIISASLFEKLKKLNMVKSVEPSTFQCYTASREPLPISCCATFKLKIAHFTWMHTCLVSNELGLDFILGADFMESTGLILDMQAKHVFFKFSAETKIHFVGVTQAHNLSSEISSDSKGKSDSNSLTHLNESQCSDISKLCDQFPKVLTSKLGLTDLLEYQIKLIDKEYVKSHPYRLAPPKMELLRQEVQELLDKGVIEQSTSQYASPAFLVPKSNGKQRMVVDYRKLNHKIEIESIPLPDLHSAFHWFGKAKIFTTIDLNAAYHQIPLSKDSKPITSFCVPWNLYQFNRVPFGLATGAQVLTRLLDRIFHDVKFKYVYNYLDDLVIYSETFEQHLEHLREVFTRLEHAGLTVNPKKVKFAVPEISFLGHRMSSKGISIDPERTYAIQNFPPPRDAKGIARFIGMIQFFGKFIPHLAEKAAPLNKLRRKGVKFEWGDEQQKAFETLKNDIIHPPVLRMADFSKSFILQTDASNSAVGAVLAQEVDGVRQPIAFASRTLTEQEKKSSIYELECLAVVFGIDKFRQYLEHAEFLLETDNQALSWLLAHPRQLGKIGRWVVRISSLKFKVQHIKGSQNVVADALSRMFEGYKTSDLHDIPVNCNLITDFPLAFTDIRKHQNEDNELSVIIQNLNSGVEQKPYVMDKGILYCKARNQKHIVLPAHLIPMVFEYFHASPLGGHLGIYKTIEAIREKFVWKSMNADISERVKVCKLCALSKPAQNTHLGFLASEVAQKPMEKLFIDFVGPLPRSKSGHNMLLVCIDAFSKFVWLIPVRKADALTTIQTLRANVFQNFGIPLTIVSDNGSQFTSKLFKNMCFSHGIRHITLSPYYPCPSHAERFNRNLRSALIAFHAKEQTNWDKNLTWLQMAFNFAHHESHKDIPFNLMFTYKPNNPLANLWRLNDLLPDNPKDVPEVWAAALKNLKRSHQRSRIKYNRNRTDNPFHIGDLVLCKAHPVSRAVDKRMAKLSYRWSGPYRIQRFLTPVTASLVHPDAGNFVTRAHISHLKRFYGKIPTQS